MTGNIASFYLFIRNNMNNDWTEFKNQVDTNRNGTIQFNELNSFFKRTSAFQNMNTTDTLDIWNQIDRNINGMVGGVSNDGALDAVEESRIKNQVVVYGQIYDAVLDEINKINPDYYSNVFTADEWANEVVTCYVATYGTNTNNLNDTTIQTLLKQAAKNVIKNKACDACQGYISSMVESNYSLKTDNDLKKLIDNAAVEFDIDQLWKYKTLINRIVDTYVAKGGLNVSWHGNYTNLQDYNSSQGPAGDLILCSWDYSESGVYNMQGSLYDPTKVLSNNYVWGENNDDAKLSSMQKSVLRNYYEKTISLNALKTCSNENYRYDFTAFSSEFNTAYTAYVNGNLNKKQSDYAGPEGLYKTASTSGRLLKDFFQNTDVGSLAHVAYNYNIAKSSCTSANNFDNWEGISKNLCWVCGMSKENAAKFVQSDYFKTVLLDVAKALRDNGYTWEGGEGHSIADAGSEMGYGTENSHCSYASTFIEHYIQEHMTEILNKIGVTDKNEVESNLFWNARNSATSVWPRYSDKHTRSYDELKNHALQYWEFLNKTLTDVQKAQIFGENGLEIQVGDNTYQCIPNINNLKACFQLIGNSAAGWTYDYTVKILDGVHNAVVKALNGTSGTGGTNQTGGGTTTKIDVDTFMDYVQNNTCTNPTAYQDEYLNWQSANTVSSTFPLAYCMAESYDSERKNYPKYCRVFSTITPGGSETGRWEEQKSAACNNFHVISNTIYNYARDNGVDPNKAAKARVMLESFFNQVFSNSISGIENQTFNADHGITDNWWSPVSITDSNNEAHEWSSNAVIYVDDTSTNVNDIGDYNSHLGKAQSGIYMGVQYWGNDSSKHCLFVFVDMREMVNKFNKFLEWA